MTGIPSVRLYLSVFATLLALTALTVFAAFRDLGPFNTVVALGIAATKASLVGLFFMHLRWGARLDRLFAIAGIVWFAILAGMTLAEVLTRGWRTMVF